MHDRWLWLRPRHVIETLELIINTVSNQSVQLFSLGCFLNTFSLYSCVLKERTFPLYVSVHNSACLHVCTYSWVFFASGGRILILFYTNHFVLGQVPEVGILTFVFFFPQKMSKFSPLLAWLPPLSLWLNIDRCINYNSFDFCASFRPHSKLYKVKTPTGVNFILQPQKRRSLHPSNFWKIFSSCC